MSGMGLMGQLDLLFKQLVVSSRVFFFGVKCESRRFDGFGDVGQLHIILRGDCTVLHPSGVNDGVACKHVLTRPSVVFFPRPYPHTLIPDEHGSTEVICATVDLGGRPHSSLVNSLPEISILDIGATPTLAPTVALLLDEATTQRNGQRAALDRLLDYFLIQLIRHLATTDAIQRGVLLALKEPRLLRAITAVHENPAQDWTIDELATLAAMSRAKFTQYFRSTMGCSVTHYVTQWRIGVAKRLLQQGKPMKVIATTVGYQSPSALSRVFFRHVGATPSEWAAQNR